MYDYCAGKQTGVCVHCSFTALPDPKDSPLVAGVVISPDGENKNKSLNKTVEVAAVAYQ